ncbi:AAA domain-containing protein [Anaerocolumna jejuensis]|uniref:AAA domain-containing protein n=1 Tax=Anaerocolumna jejuensis TaxID=259063 RepID=UPI003F7B89A8
MTEEIQGINGAWFGSIYNYFKTYTNAGGTPEFNPVPLDIGYNSSFVADSQKNDFEMEQLCGYVLEVWKCEVAKYARDFRNFFSDGIVVPHRAQRTAIRKKLFGEFKRNLPSGLYTDAEIRETINGAVDTVERFQGQKRDLIISGYVLGNEDAIGNEESFIYDKCRLKVIISRAKYKAIIIASRELLDNISDDIETIELQKSFPKLKDYCDTISSIIEPG